MNFQPHLGEVPNAFHSLSTDAPHASRVTPPWRLREWHALHRRRSGRSDGGGRGLLVPLFHHSPLAAPEGPWVFEGLFQSWWAGITLSSLLSTWFWQGLLPEDQVRPVVAMLLSTKMVFFDLRFGFVFWLLLGPC